MAAVASKLTPKTATALKRLAGKYNTRTAEADSLRAELDVVVAQARSERGTFREIAALAGRSVAWVQGSLERTKRGK